VRVEPLTRGATHSIWARAAFVSGLLLLVLPAATSPPESGAAKLAGELKNLYPRSVDPWERWRRRASVIMADGREVPREEAWRDDPGFVVAAAHLLSTGAEDDARLGAWLLGTAAPELRPEAEAVLIEALSHTDQGAAFQAVAALAVVGGDDAGEALLRAARVASTAEVRTASARAAVELAGSRDLEQAALAELAHPRGGVRPFASSFRRGVSWWRSEGRDDDGRASFRRVASLGVTWVSIHTWDPLQRGFDEPVFATTSHRHGLPNLGGLVRNAHAAGLAVMVKPHLEMRGYRPTPEERLVLRGPEDEARRRLIVRMQEQSAAIMGGGHNRLLMGNDADWGRWFEEYEDYILPYARDAQASGADMFCVGRELDSTVIRRESDWRRLIGLIRTEFEGPLVYSANFDSWEQIGFWDALDFIGVSAYFPLSGSTDPSLEELEAGWAQALEPLEAASKRWDRPVLLTEAGFPSIGSAARAPWREEKTPADVWLQARCYEATLRTLASRPWIEGSFFWLWERSSKPPFRDPSHTIVDKPAMFTMARWYSAQ